jgi:hypothetical protein
MKAPSSGRRRISVVAYGWVLLLGVTMISSMASAGGPVVRILVGLDHGNVVFEFRPCNTTKRAAPLRLTEIVIGEVGHLSDICKRSSMTGLPQDVSRWTYGSNLTGFEGSRCEPLKRGRKYAIATIGTGEYPSTGLREFSLDEKGGLRVGLDTCEGT